MNIRTPLRIIVVLCMLLLVSAALAQTVVTMWTFLDPSKTSPREVALKQMIEDFERENPDIRIVVEPQDFAIMPTKFFLGHTTGTNPDIVWVDAKNLGGLILSGAGADLNELFLGDWTEEQDADFYGRASWNAVVQDGRKYAVPLFPGTSVIYYRKDLFEQAGIDPSSIRSWDDFGAAAQDLTIDTDGDDRIDVWGFGFPFKSEKTQVSPGYTALVETSGELFDECTPNYATEEGLAALQLDASFVRDLGVTPTESFVNHGDDTLEQFQAGRHAMTVGPSLRFTRLRGVVSFGGENLGILPWPSVDGNDYPGPLFNGGWFAAVWDRSDKKEEAGRFVEYMISPAGIRLWSVIGGQVPIRSSVLEDPYFSGPEWDHLRVLRDMWAHASWNLPLGCNTAAIQADWNEAAQQVVQNAADPVRALEEVERKFVEAQ